MDFNFDLIPKGRWGGSHKRIITGDMLRVTKGLLVASPDITERLFKNPSRPFKNVIYRFHIYFDPANEAIALEESTDETARTFSELPRSTGARQLVGIALSGSLRKVFIGHEGNYDLVPEASNVTRLVFKKRSE